MALALCLIALAPLARAQGEPASAAKSQTPADQMFSGDVTAIDSASLTAVRTGSKVEKKFLITPETKFEGKPHVKSRVTIRYVMTDDGPRALRVIVRVPAAKK
ncbi:MAG TPA: hypothetical protein VMU19_13845 [Bryobacteraceae bacterium]|nr:hypothetical protein [Bryobacteraceae bacterium]